jgi:Outer membrane protein beta-barrel domain
MKFKFILSALILLSAQAFLQSKNTISLVYGAAGNLVDIHNAIGDFGYNPQSGYQYGLMYSRKLSKVFSLETGLMYSANKIQLVTDGPGGGTYNQKLDMLTVPVYADFTFLKYLYAQTGFLLDHETNYTSDHNVNDQSGFGIELGIGGKYSAGPISVFVNPFLCRHAVNARNNLLEAGARFGLGFNF